MLDEWKERVEFRRAKRDVERSSQNKEFLEKLAEKYEGAQYKTEVVSWILGSFQNIWVILMKIVQMNLHYSQIYPFVVFQPTTKVWKFQKWNSKAEKSRKVILEFEEVIIF